MLLVNVLDRTMRDFGIFKLEDFPNARYLMRAELFEFKTFEDAERFVDSLGDLEVLLDKSKGERKNLFYGLKSGPLKGLIAVTIFDTELWD
jgi:hypothetical protein